MIWNNLRGVHWFPAPEEDPLNPGKYKDFSSCYKSSDIKPTETCRPFARKEVSSSSLPQPPFKYVVQKARACVQCVECKKGSLLYSDRKLTEDMKAKLQKSIEDGWFICGSEFFEEGNILNETVFQHHLNNCQKNMTAAYFSTGPKCLFYEYICPICFEKSSPAVEDTDNNGLPRCENCKEAGYKCLKYQK